MFDGNQHIILLYLTFVKSQVICFAQITHIKYLLPILMINSYKVGVVFDSYQRMRAK